MRFTFDEDQLLAAQSLRDLLDDHCTGADLRRAAEAVDGDGYRLACDTRRQRLSELGLATALVSEAQGGLGLKLTDVVLIAEEAGRAALPEPLIETMGVALPLLAELAASDERARAAFAAAMVDESVRVLWSDSIGILDTDHARFVVMGEGTHSLELHDIHAGESMAIKSVDPLRRLTRWRSRDGSLIAVINGVEAKRAWQLARARARVLAAAQLLGLSQRMTSLAVAYALDRKQFGKAIGVNQAVKHQLANVQIKIEFARPVIYAAAAAAESTLVIDEAMRVQRDVRVAHAFVAACDAADLAARTAIQVHGAMGYSWELDLQFYAKRAWALAGLHGGRSGCFRLLHEMLMTVGIEVGPDRVFDNPMPEGA